MSMDRRVFRISVMGGQIFREILRPPPQYVLPPSLNIFSLHKKYELFRAKPKQIFPPWVFLSPPPLYAIFIFLTSLFGLLRGCRYFSGGGGQDSLLEGSRFPCYAPVNGECIFQTHKKEKSPAYLYFLN